MFRGIIRLLSTTPKPKPTPASKQAAEAQASNTAKQAAEAQASNTAKQAATNGPQANSSSSSNYNPNANFNSQSPPSFTTSPGRSTGGNMMGESTSFTTNKEAIPDVMVTFGTRMNQITFVSHPGVMAVSKLLEMNSFTTTKTTLTQENVDAIKEFDEELAMKAQIAVDNNLSINFADMDYLDKPDVLEMFLNDKKALEKIREDVMSMAPNDYTFPESLNQYKRPEVPKTYRPELIKEQEMLEATQEGREYLALHKAAEDFINKTAFPESPSKTFPVSSTKKIS